MHENDFVQNLWSFLSHTFRLNEDCGQTVYRTNLKGYQKKIQVIYLLPV